MIRADQPQADTTPGTSPRGTVTRTLNSSVHKVLMINGDVAPGYEVVKEQFAENLASHKEVGAACAVSLDGDPVVDLWRG